MREATPDPKTRLAQFERKQRVISALGLLVLIGLAIVVNSITMTSVAEQSTKMISRMIQIGDFREVGVTLQEARLDNFRVIRYQSKRSDRSFVLPPRAAIFEDRSFWRRFSNERVTFNTFSPISAEAPDTIVFEYDRFRLVPYGILIWLILNLVSIPQTRFVRRRMQEQFQRDLVAERAMAKAQVSREVRHNLRTPLAILSRIPARMPASSRPDRELLDATILQIRALISKLDDGSRVSDSADGLSDQIYDTLKQAVSEIAETVPTGISFSSDIDDGLSSAKVPHIPVELRSVLANVVNNAFDATPAGSVAVLMKDVGHQLEIRVFDTGKGIESEHLSKIFDEGFTAGKQNGTGIGLFHAKTWIEKWRGRISVESVPGVGTNLTITLPIDDRAAWYTPRIRVPENAQIAILDDQPIGREVWRYRFSELGFLNPIHFLATKDDFDALRRKSNDDLANWVFLFDYDIGSAVTGLDLLKMLNTPNRFLVTGHFDEPQVRAECENAGVYLIPKSHAADIPIIQPRRRGGAADFQSVAPW